MSLSGRAWGPVILASLLIWLPACESKRLVVGYLGAPDGACLENGETCDDQAQCCDGSCESGVCGSSAPACGAFDATCAGPRDCCSAHCVSGKCSASCVSDSLDCSEDSDCCSGQCSGGVCAALADGCATSGNACDDNDECCSGLCLNEACDINSSFCSQVSDVCASDDECCSGTCVFSSSGYLGVCDEAPSGASNCNDGIAGTVCDSCNDCCSRLCVPFGATGTSVCQQAQGCRQTGEICQTDGECCGGEDNSPLPGAGNVSCDKRDEDRFGVCRNAMSCSPQGNACHFQDYACSVSAASNRCCGEDGYEGECVLDTQGVPRCAGLGNMCFESGESCAFDRDCCAGRCLPDVEGRLRCAAQLECQGEGAPCGSSADCCPQTICQRLTDSSFGACSATGALECSLSGQLCGEDYPDCCGDAPCEDGYCRVLGAP